MTDTSKITDANIAEAACLNDLDAALAFVQGIIGQPHGDVAGAFFSGFDDAAGDWTKSSKGLRANWLIKYLEVETANA